DRLVGVSFDEIDDDLVTDTRQVHGSPFLAGPEGTDANPARAIGVVLAVAVPAKLDFYPALLFRQDLHARRSDAHGRLRAIHDRLGGLPRRTKGHRQRYALEAVLVIPAKIAGGTIVARQRGRVLHTFQQIGPIGIEMTLQREFVPARELPAG